MDMVEALVTVSVGPQGRIVIPAEMRREWGLEQGETLVVRFENHRLVLERPLDALDRFIRRHPQLKEGPSIVDELIAERRLEAAREREESD